MYRGLGDVYKSQSSLGIAVIGTAIALTLFFIDKRMLDLKKDLAAEGPKETNAVNDEEDFF